MRRRIQPDNSAAITLTAVAATVVLLYIFRGILWPFALALVLAILIQAFIRAVVTLWPWADRRVVLALSGIVALVLMFAAGLVVLPGVAQLVGELPLLQSRVDGLLVDVSRQVGLEVPLTLQMLLGGLDIRATAAWGLRGVRDAVSGLVLTALFLIFLLFCWGLIERRIRLAAGRGGSWPARVLQRSFRGVEAYVWIQTLSGFVNAAVGGLVMFAVGLEHWLFWAVILFILAYIPFLGVAIGSIAPSLFALLQFPSATPAILIFLSIQATAFVTGNLMVPRMQATTQNIDPCASLLAVGGWTIVWGMPGAFLAIPLTLALIYHFAGTPRLRWLAILLSNDGDPFDDDMARRRP